jgi:hypothetical protein
MAFGDDPYIVEGVIPEELVNRVRNNVRRDNFNRLYGGEAASFNRTDYSFSTNSYEPQEPKQEINTMDNSINDTILAYDVKRGMKFYTVKFDSHGKEYTYKSRTILEVGDAVIVEANDKLQVVHVYRTEVAPPYGSNYPIRNVITVINDDVEYYEELKEKEVEIKGKIIEARMMREAGELLKLAGLEDDIAAIEDSSEVKDTLIADEPTTVEDNSDDDIPFKVGEYYKSGATIFQIIDVEDNSSKYPVIAKDVHGEHRTFTRTGKFDINRDSSDFMNLGEKVEGF